MNLANTIRSRQPEAGKTEEKLGESGALGCQMFQLKLAKTETLKKSWPLKQDFNDRGQKDSNAVTITKLLPASKR